MVKKQTPQPARIWSDGLYVVRLLPDDKPLMDYPVGTGSRWCEVRVNSGRVSRISGVTGTPPKDAPSSCTMSEWIETQGGEEMALAHLCGFRWRQGELFPEDEERYTITPKGRAALRGAA